VDLHVVSFIKYYVGDEAMRVEMGWAHDTCEVEHKYTQGSNGET